MCVVAFIAINIFQFAYAETRAFWSDLYAGPSDFGGDSSNKL